MIASTKATTKAMTTDYPSRRKLHHNWKFGKNGLYVRGEKQNAKFLNARYQQESTSLSTIWSC
jgi:hypothetical protein